MSKKLKKEMSLLVNEKEILIGLRRSRRAKNILLKVGMKGEVEVVVPWHVSFIVAEWFVKEKARWLRKTLDKKKEQGQSVIKQSFKDGALLSVLGDVKRLVVKVEFKRARSRYKEKGDFIEVVVASCDEVQCVLERWYRERAQQYFDQRVAYYEKLLGVEVLKVVVSGARTQWGSCMRNKCRVSLQWRLAQAPLYVVDYVIVHEMMHLKVGGHNERFWNGVEKFCPEYNQCRKWLRDKGPGLYW